MTSRERVRFVLAGKKPDRIPNGLGATINTGMHLLTYQRLARLCGVEDHAPRMMSFEANALPSIPFLRAVQADMVSLGIKITPARFWGPQSDGDWKEERLWGHGVRIPRQWTLSTDAGGNSWIDGFRWDPIVFNVPLPRAGCRLLCPSGGRYFDPVALPGSPENADPTPDDYHPPRDFPDEMLRGLEESARWLHENTPYSIVCDEMINDLQLTPGGQERWWMRMLSEPQTVHDFLDKACEAGLSQLRLVDQAVGKYADMHLVAHDFGDLRGVMMGPGLWREIYKPHFAKLFGEWRRISRMKVAMHSCGSIAEILDDLVDCGLQVINPVQISAANMDPGRLKERYAGRLVFYGGSYDAVACPVDTPAEAVHDFVSRNIRTLSRGGGYIFAGVHNIQPNVSDAHLRAILDAFKESRDEAEP